ncbi:unnamed protein product, partial [Rhizoctonia solani]
WKTYVREADQVDEELVDGWNKSMDVILIFAALFSAISTAFVIESYKNLKQEPTDVSSQTLLIISHTLMLIANGSQPGSISADSESETPPFQASSKAICVNVLWFLSLSLSVAVSLISMLAKEWCLEYMANRTGTAEAQARRRQQRWDGLEKWRMKELIMMLPSLIHLSLLLFAIGLCVFLWDVHYGVAIPVVFVTAFAASAYFVCTFVPFFYDYCPYGTVLSRLAKQFMVVRLHPSSANVIQDEVTGNALNWMIANCETPRSIDIALQSLAAADEKFPIQVLEKHHAWVMIKQRLEYGGTTDTSEHHKKATQLFKRALEVYPATRRRIDMLNYGYAHPDREVADALGREEQVMLGIQATIQSLGVSHFSNVNPKDVVTIQLLRQCANIGQYHLSRSDHRVLEGINAQNLFKALVRPSDLMEQLVQKLEQYLKNEVTFDSDVYCNFSASLAFLLCCNTAGSITAEAANVKYVLSLVHSFSKGSNKTTSNLLRESILLNLVLGLPWLLGCYTTPEKCGEDTSLMKALECLWPVLLAAAYPDTSATERHDITYLTHGMLSLLANPNKYSLSSEDCKAIQTVLDQAVRHRGLPTKIQSIYHAHYIHSLTQNIMSADDTDALAPQVLSAVNNLRVYSPWDDYYVLPSIDIYIFVVKHLCMAKDSSSADSYHAYWILGSSPIPKCSPQLVQALSSSDLITHLVNAIDSDDRDTRLFATAQLWVFIQMSICEADRTSPALSLLETELLKYPKLEGNMERQEAVAEELEDKLPADIDEGSLYINRYTCRVLEVMFQRRSTPLPRLVHSRLNIFDTPKRLHGIDSFVNYETERSVAYPDLVFDSEGRPSCNTSSEEQRA